MPCRRQRRMQRRHVRHADRLATRHVHGRREAHVGDGACAMRSDEALELREVHVALERAQVRRVVGRVDDHVDERAAGEFLVEARGREVHVARHELALADRGLAQEVLGAAALVRGHDEFVAVVLPDRVLEVVVVPAAGVGLVAEHHAGPLTVAHRVRAAVGEQVDVDVVRAQQERVEAGLGQRTLALRARRDAQGLDHLDLPGLGPGTPAGLLAHGPVHGVAHVGPPWRARRSTRRRSAGDGSGL